jgi:arginyl-tRNA synthetase
MIEATQALRDALQTVFAQLVAGTGQNPPEAIFETPKQASHGDLAITGAMGLARALKRNPREIATDLVQRLQQQPAVRRWVQSLEIAGPGFVNLRLTPAARQAIVAEVLAAGERFGTSERHRGQRVMVEFVSANPTGPLHVGHGRQAALGDAISTLLEWQAWKVTREFYYNDAGAQIANLAKSTQARVRELAGQPLVIPDGGYHGDYIREIAERYVQENPDDRAGDDLDAMRRFAVAALRHEQDLDLQAFGVTFDTYYLESSLYTDGLVDKTVEALEHSGYTYEEEGALFLRTTEFGDDKDRVMKKSAAKGGDYTYFVPDVAYHVTKWERGYHRAINVQGADHHSTTTRVRAGLQALYPEHAI